MEKKYWKLHHKNYGNCIGNSEITNDGKFTLEVIYCYRDEFGFDSELTSIKYEKPYYENSDFSKVFDLSYGEFFKDSTFSIVKELSEDEYSSIALSYKYYCLLCKEKYNKFEEIKKLIENA